MRQVDQLTELTVEQLEEKIKQVAADIKQMQSNGNDKQSLVLTDYKEYLEEELTNLKNAKKTS
jgi:hypothetical protein